jgi:hypothetical protein
MRLLVLVQVLYGVAAMAVFAVGYGLRWRRWWPSATGRQLMAMAATLVLVVGSLLAAAFVPVPMWLFAAVFFLFDAMATGWLVLLVRTRHDGLTESNHHGARR